MQSLILIGNENFNIDSIIQVKHNNSIKEYYVNTNRYVVEFEDGHIYYDYDKNFVDDYEKHELTKIPFLNPQFISMTFTSKGVMKRVILQDNFLKGIYVDDDNGSIISIEEFRKKLS